MLSEELRWDTVVTFDVIRDVCRRYGTPFLPTAERVVWLSEGSTLLVRSELGVLPGRLDRWRVADGGSGALFAADGDSPDRVGRGGHSGVGGGGGSAGGDDGGWDFRRS